MTRFCPACGEFFETDSDRCPRDGTELRPIEPVPDRLSPGEILDGRFEIIERLGRGGMGSVYRARQTSVGREVALKVIDGPRDTGAIKRFMLEARATAALTSVHTVTIFDFGQADGVLYIAMELLRGESLSQRITRVGRHGWRDALQLCAPIFESLEEAHERGVVHRDLKPANLYLSRQGHVDDFVKVLDFGVARFVEGTIDDLTGSGRVVGTPAYMSPEQARGEPVDHRSDLYCVGLILFELLSGQRPFQADSAVGLLLKQVSQPIPSLASLGPPVRVPGPVEELLARLLAKKRTQRFESARDARAGIEHALSAPPGDRRLPRGHAIGGRRHHGAGDRATAGRGRGRRDGGRSGTSGTATSLRHSLPAGYGRPPAGGRARRGRHRREGECSRISAPDSPCHGGGRSPTAGAWRVALVRTSHLQPPTVHAQHASVYVDRPRVRQTVGERRRRGAPAPGVHSQGTDLAEPQSTP